MDFIRRDRQSLTPTASMIKSIKALEKRRSLLTLYSILEKSEDVIRIINSKHLKRRKIQGLCPDGKREIYEREELVAFRLRDFDSDGKERIYSLGGWD